MTYRAKAVFDAVQFTGNISEIVAHVGQGAQYEHGELVFSDAQSPAGPWRVTAGDWVLKDTEGFFDVVSDEDFQAHYEALPA